MAETSTTDRQGWVEGLDRLTKDPEGQDVTIEVLDRSFGDQTEAERLPFAYADWCLNLDCQSNHVISGLTRVGVRRYICSVCRHELTGPTSQVLAHRRTH